MPLAILPEARRIIVPVLAWWLVQAAPPLLADHLTGLDITGVAANAGPWSWPPDSEYSWISHRFPSASTWHSWRLHPGTDAGIRFQTSQAYGALTSEFLMFNVPTALFSDGNGITLDNNERINMDMLRKKSGKTVLDLGSGSGVEPLVPLVNDVTMLAAGQNGWQTNNDGSYHLIYNTVGNCAGCQMIIHLYGTAIPVQADGDISGDGRVSVADILLLERHLAGLVTLTPGQKARADLAPPGQPDGTLTTADLYLLTRLALQ